jgi:hypothetical protein
MMNEGKSIVYEWRLPGRDDPFGNNFFAKATATDVGRGMGMMLVTIV